MMKKLRILLMASAGMLSGGAQLVNAQQAGALYGGTGSANESAGLDIDDTPFVVGALFYPGSQALVIGFDIAGEGQMLDSTFGTDSLRQALSINGILGGNVYRTSGFRADVSAIVGFRESFADCPDSFLGFQCYADEEPDTEYELNYGALLSMNFERFMVGIRATDVSTQAVVGVSF